MTTSASGADAANTRENGSAGASGAVPNRAPTIVDVARHAGVSKSVVSRVLRGSPWVSPQRSQAVLAAAAELGYRPNAVARSLVQRRSFNVGVVISDLDILSSYGYFAEVLDGITSVARSRGYHVLITTGQRDPAAEAAELERLLELRVDGVLLINTNVPAETVRAANRAVPVVLVRSPIRVPDVDTVTANDVRGAELAVEYLAGLGHRRIALIGGPGQRGRDRLEGYERAMRRCSLADEMVVTVDDRTRTEEGGYLGARRLLDSRPRPTAICARNDLGAVGALNAFAEAGLAVPGDISLVGYDNTALSALRHIALTTVEQPRRESGELAMSLLLERLERPGGGARLSLAEPRLVIRSTTGPPSS